MKTGHFICSQKRTFSLATDISELPVTRPEHGLLGFFCLDGSMSASAMIHSLRSI
jgi:hypothetical protein